MKRFLLSLSTLIVALPFFGQQTKIMTAEKHNEYGLVYTLPTTALRITVTARKETAKAGPFKQYARHYLGTSNVIQEDKVTWKITDVAVSPIGVKDDDTQYLMQLKPGAMTYVGVDANGMLLSVNTEPRQIDTPSPQLLPPEGKLISSTGGVEDYLRYVDMDFVSAQNSMRQAEMVANSLMDVRDSYLSLTRGTADNVPTDGKQLELMLNSLKEQESALSRAFAGSVTVEEFTSQYIFMPESEGEEVLFRLSDFSGFVDADDYSGAPVYIKTEVMYKGEMPKDATTGEEKAFPKDGIVYAIPGSAKITIYTSGGTNFFNKEMEFSQFGTKFGLAPTLFSDKKAPTYAIFSPITGGILEIGSVKQEKAEKASKSEKSSESEKSSDPEE